LHQTIHPWRHLLGSRHPHEGDDNLGACAVDFPSPDLDHTADGHRFVAPQIQDPFKDEVCIQPRRAKRGCIAGLKGQRDQDARVKRAVVISVARQNEVVGERFTIVGLRFGHEMDGEKAANQLRR
jgi:hypothetical protein